MSIKNDVHSVGAKSSEPLFSTEDLKKAAMVMATVLVPVAIPLAHIIKNIYVNMSECETELWKERAKELISPSSIFGTNGSILATTVKDIRIRSAWMKTCSDGKPTPK